MRATLIALMAFFIAGCMSSAGVRPSEDYQFGDLSVRYCSASNSAARQVLKIALDSVTAYKGLPLGVDYCKAISHLGIDYEPQDLVSAWCNTSKVKEKAYIELVFKNQFIGSDVVLEKGLCGGEDV